MFDLGGGGGEGKNVTGLFPSMGSTRELGDLLRMAESRDLATRLVQGYLGAIGFSTASVEVAMTMGYVQLAALQGFLAEQRLAMEGAIEWPAFNSRIDHIKPPRTKLLETAPGTQQVVLESGLVFLKERRWREDVAADRPPWVPPSNSRSS